MLWNSIRLADRRLSVTFCNEVWECLETRRLSIQKYRRKETNPIGIRLPAVERIIRQRFSSYLDPRSSKSFLPILLPDRFSYSSVHCALYFIGNYLFTEHRK